MLPLDHVINGVLCGMYHPSLHDLRAIEARTDLLQQLT